MNEWLGENSLVVMIAALAVTGIVLILLVLVIVLFVKQRKLLKKYEAFMGGEDGKTLEEEVLRRFKEIQDLKEEQLEIQNHLKKIDETLLITYQKVGIVKYNAFQETGGKLSFALAMLNDTNDGFVMNSMHSSREGCYTYVKEIIKGESFVVLSSEEQEALDRALETKNYMG